MFTLLLPVLVVLAVVWRALKPAERLRLLQAVASMIERARRLGSGELQEFDEKLRARTRYAIVTLALVAVTVTVFIGMLFGHGALSDPATLVGWGASVGPRTTNGEWSRLLTMAFVNRSVIGLAINMAALFQLGILLERLVGRIAFTINYFVAILCAALTSVAAYPTTVCAGSSGAVFGIYGLLVASIAGGLWHRSPVTIPGVAIVRFAPIGALFVLYNCAASGLGFRGDLVGFVTGLVFGSIVARDVSESIPATRTLIAVTTALMIVAAGAALALRGIIDVRPEIQRLVDIEHQTSGTYDAALDKFRKGRLQPAGLAELIDRRIVPELQAAELRINDLRGVPAQDQPRLDDAKAYLRLRSESWRLRSHGIRESSAPAPSGPTESDGTVSPRRRAEARLRSNAMIMANAESSAQAALQALDRISPDTDR